MYAVAINNVIIQKHRTRGAAEAAFDAAGQAWKVSLIGPRGSELRVRWMSASQ